MRVTSEDIREEIDVVMERAVEASVYEYQDNTVRSVTVPLNLSGAVLTLDVHNIEELLSGKSVLSIELTVPMGQIDSSEDSRYARDLYGNEAPEVISEAVSEWFGTDESYKFRYYHDSASSMTFGKEIEIQNPSQLPTDDDMEIVPVVEVDITKTWVRKDTNQHVGTASTADLALPTDNHKDQDPDSIEKTVSMFGSTFEIDLSGKGVQLVREDGSVVGYPRSFVGEWRGLTDKYIGR